ncbi:MAG: class I SAM-dependent rRNA methyltransferase [Lachnospiraceae bacterium]|jgi:23S rRNA (cytosine1962-C5)-methyltransferase|nr:class I SAM-dependent rRNA methyltransferase [Lachnospiraceae bacterium]
MTDVFEITGTVTLARHEGRFLKSGGDWIFDNEIADISADAADGSLVQVKDFDGYDMGAGFINRRSKITVRMLTRGHERPDAALFAARVRSCIEGRRVYSDLSCCRLIFGEADGFPGLVADLYSGYLVCQITALGMERLFPAILPLIREELAAAGTPVKGVLLRNDEKVREKEGLPLEKKFAGEAFDTRVPIVENGVKYIVDVMDGQKTGFFLDQKENRAAVQRLVGGLKKTKESVRVLDCFTHTGSFALNAARAGATQVLAVDASDLAIAQARENAEMNGWADRVQFLTADVFDFLPQQVQEKELYDLVILDPPAFTKSRNSVKAASRGYRQINSDGMRLVAPGGYLATCTCSHFMEPELFRKTIAEAAHIAHRRLSQVYSGTQAPDHTYLWGLSESLYLKFYIFRLD